jgi:hypothetical protein
LIGRDKLFDAVVCSSRQDNNFFECVIITVSHESTKFVIM